MFPELIVDNFAGGGGASLGIEMAIGRHVDIAINHDPAAIAMHKKNHPTTEHYCESVWDVDPVKITKGWPVSLCWLSPDCKHFSKAKGGKPVEKAIRGLAWVAVRWAATVRPRVIILENVEEFKTWGPLLQDGKPDPDKKGKTFGAFVNALRRQGYVVEWRELKACDYGAPTIRKRLFLIARCDGQKIIWPKQTHGAGLIPYRTAAEIIDWSIPCPSIFERSRPLAENTMRRIARGIQKFVLDSPEPFVIKVNHHGEAFRGQEIGEPLQTITAKNGWGIVTPTLIQTGYGERHGQNPRAPGLDKPLGTVVAGGVKHALIAPTLIQYHGEQSERDVRGQDLQRPLMVVDSSPRYALVSSFLTKFYNTNIGSDLRQPVPTITATGQHIGEVRAFLLKYYGTGEGQSLAEPLHTVTSKEHFGLVTVKGEQYQIADIGMRMLEPRELFRAQGFPDSYIIDFDVDGKRYSKKDQVARCGNSVSPVIPAALVRANLPDVCREEVPQRIARRA